MDGKIDIMDVIRLNKLILGTVTIDDPKAKANADMDGNGVIDSNDALAVLKLVVA
jgi:hypothetical protein